MKDVDGKVVTHDEMQQNDGANKKKQERKRSPNLISWPNTTPKPLSLNCSRQSVSNIVRQFDVDSSACIH
eukprot:scaffold17853_cov65-Cyclotella_meneghiniana.AAC.4